MPPTDASLGTTQENFTSLDTTLKVILDAVTEVPGVPNVDAQFDPEEPGTIVP